MVNERRSPRQRKHSSSTPPRTVGYYAGARFETAPLTSSLPTPPPRWTMSSPRSQSMPSSPITTNMMSTLGSGERNPPVTLSGSAVFKSASFPSDSTLMNLLGIRKIPVEVQTTKTPEKKPTTAPVPVPAKVEEKVSGDDLIRMLIAASPVKRGEQEEMKKSTLTPVTTPVKPIPRPIPKSCGQEVGLSTDTLKSLLKLSA